MKKRLYAILLTSFFLVGIMAAAAAASQVALDTSSFRNRLTITAGSGSAAAGSTTAGSISGVRVGETASAKLTLISAGTLRVDPIEGNSATVVITNVASGAASLDITGVKAGDTKIRIYSGTAESVDVKITVQAATKPVFNVAGNNVDLGHIYDGSNDAFYANQTIRSVDMSFDTKETVLGYRVSLDVARGNGVTSLTATFEPKLDTLNFVTSVDGAAYVDPTAGNNQTEKSYGLKGWLEGTMPNVKADTVYVMTLTATDAAGNSTTSKYKFKVLALPDVSKTKSPKDITWGKADNWTFTPVGTNVDSWDIAISKDNGEKLLSADYIISVDALAEKANIKFDYKTGKMQFGNGSSTEGDELYGWGKSWKPGRQNNYIIVSEDLKTPVTKKVKLIGWKGKGPKAVSASIEIDLNFISEKPALKSGYSLKDFTFNWSEDIKSKDDSGNPKNYIDIEGPGEITVDSADSGLPEGITMFVSEDKSNTSLTRIFFQGKPAETTASKGKKIKFTVKNKADDTGLVLQPTVIVKTDKVSFDVAMNDNANIPSGDVMIKDTITDVTLRAFPGPITWKLENAPKGMTITADKDDSTKAVLSGTYTTARGLKDTRNYKIIATNSDWGKSNTISTDLMVWPELSFKTKSDKAITIKAGSKADFTIELNGYPVAASYDISFDTKVTDYTQLLNGTTAGWGTFKGAKAVSFGNSIISLDLAKLSKDSTKLIFTGSWDRLPDRGETTLTVKAKSPVVGKNDLEGVFTIKVQGVAPKFGSTKEIKLTADGAWSKDTKLAEGTPSIDFTAKIDESTAKKIFGSDASEIELKDTWDTTSGLSFDFDAAKGTFSFKVSSDMHMAYNKLPVTVTANNPQVSDKLVTAKLSITVAGNDPKWYTVNSLDLAPFSGGSNFAASKDVTNKTGTLYLDASQTSLSGDNYVKFIISGDGPLTYTCKPAFEEEKNGIQAVLDKDAKTVLFKGAPTAEKGDTTTKFTLSAKNNSTGKEAKLTLTFTAVPKPTIDTSDKAAKNLTWEGIYGKKLKIAPKLEKKTKKVKWVVEGASTDVSFEGVMSGYGATSDKQGAAQLKTDTGLILDSSKGTITGAFNKSTGKDKPYYIKIRASGDITSSDAIYAKVTVLGEKAKLATKSVTVDIDGGTSLAMNPSKIDTNLSTGKTKRTDNKIASVDVTGEFTDDGALNLSIASNGDNTFALSGTPNKVVKKVNVPLTFTNYDTETTGKLAISVKGKKPEIGTLTSIAVTAGDAEESIALKITNPTKVSDKIKWKIDTKPSVSGISAKIKADDSTGLTATLSVKASNKVTTGGSLQLIATDSVTKEVSAKYQVTISVTPAAADAIEAKDLADKPEVVEPETTTETETVAEETAVGEGEVKLGRERTVAGLTAAQRTFFAENGYVVAAVLPEIEVEGAGGQYEFEVDELEEAAKTGAELVWFAFASKPTDDDEIVEFYDADNDAEAIKVLPESRKLIVAPWLNVGTKYAPVIAVKADAAEAEATTEEDVKAKAEEVAEEKAAEGEAEAEVKPEVKEVADETEATEKAE